MFAQTIYRSHENWGETVYADEKGMTETIASLHDLGDEWTECSIDECDEFRLIKEVGKYGIYSKSYSKSNQFVALVHHDGNKNYYSEITDNRGVVMFYSNDLEELTQEINESIERSKAAAVLGSRGGTVTTDAKAAAARLNGRKGGRPMSWESAVRIMADEGSTHEDKERAAARMCVYLDRADDTGLYDWLREGTWTGSETLESVAAELAELENS